MDKYEAVDRLRELAEEMYEAMDEMKQILSEVAPGELERARSYWMAHIDGALENREGWLGGSMISFEDTVNAVEEMDEELCEDCGERLKEDEDGGLYCDCE